MQRELGKTSSVGILGVNKQRGSAYDRAGGVDARVQLPADVNLNMEYAREWKAGGLKMVEEHCRRFNLCSTRSSDKRILVRCDLRRYGEHFNPETDLSRA